MSVAVKLGLILAAVLGVAALFGSGWWGPAGVLAIVAVLSLVQAGVAWSQARLPWFGYALILNAISAVLLAVLLVSTQALPSPWPLVLGAGVFVGLLGTAWLIRRQGRANPTTWLQFERELETASVAGVLLGRPLKALGSKST